LYEFFHPIRKAIDMTDCTTQPLLFSSLGRKKILADFNGGDLTNDGGLPLLREVDRKIGLLDALNEANRQGRVFRTTVRPRASS